MIKNILKYAFGAMLVITSLNASAVLLDGNTVTYQYYYPGLTNPYSNADNGDYVVGAGIEIANIVDRVGTMDISDTNLYVDFSNGSSFNSGSFNGFTLSDTLGTISDFTGLTLDTNMVGLTLANLSFDADTIWVNWVDLAFNADTYVSIGINSSVPEPSVLALLGVGLLGLTVARRRKMV